MKRSFRHQLAAFALVLAIAACNLPSNQTPSPDAASTAAAQTVQAQLTASAPSNTPLPTISASTNTPAPTSAPPTAAASATSSCDIGQFVTDVTIPDGYVVAPGQNFTKTWRLKNAGSCSWTSTYAVVYSSGSQMNGPATQALTGNVNPGQTVDVSINLTAPSTAGNYTGWWKLRNASGVLFAEFYVQIKVQNGGSGDSDDATFAVTSVTYSVGTYDEGTYVDCPIVTAHITANKTGDVTYHWVRSDSSGATDTLHFNSAGTKDISAKWTLGSVWAGGADEWMGIYIDSPNHQDFGHVNVPACTSP